MEEVVFRQYRWGVTIRLTCNRDAVTYFVRDSSGSHERSIAYDGIDPLSVSLVAPRAQQPTIVAYVLWISTLAFGFVQGAVHDNSAWLLISAPFAILLLAGRFTSLFELPMSVIPAAGGNGTMRIIRDQQHASILDALSTRRSNLIRAELADLNLTGDLAAEQAKFDWLLANGHITEAEHTAVSRRIAAAAQGAPPTEAVN